MSPIRAPMGLMRLVAIVLAAGEGRRMGGPKALLPLGDGTFLSGTCRLFARPGIASVVTVVGAEAARVLASGGIPAEASHAVNERWREGMLTSVWAGLDAAEALCAEAVLIHPVDNPFVARATIDAVVAAMERGALIAVPSHAGRRGHPAGFARPCWPALRAAPLDGGARSVLAALSDSVVHVEAQADCLVDVDTPGDLEAATRER